LKSVLFGGNVTTIANNAFVGCSSLESVSYLGSSDPGINSSGIFDGCGRLNMICVSESYNSPSFFGRNISCKSSSCDAVNSHCFDLVIEDGTCEAKKKKGIEKLENKSNECVEYQCDNASGILAISKCSDNASICVSDKCIDKDNANDKQWSVDITINSTEVIHMTSNEIADELKNVSGVDMDDITVGVEYDEKGRIYRIIVYFKDEDHAKTFERNLEERTEFCRRTE